MKLTQPSVLQQLQRRFDIRPDKKYGQNFLISSDAVEKIAASCGASEEDGILEIGPGVGTLTYELAGSYAKVAAVEIDEKLLPVLEYTLAEFDNVKVINADVLKVDLKRLIAEEFPGLRVSVCANLPYYITTPIIMRLLESAAGFEYITVMVQKEVADRLTASAGSADYGAITPAVAYYAEAEKVLSVPSGCFYPAPKVDSSVVRMKLHKTPPVQPIDAGFMFRVIKAAFLQRRKTLVNALCAGFPDIDKISAEAAVVSCGIDARARGETLSLQDFSRLSDALKATE